MNTNRILNRWLSLTGIASRRKCTQLIKDGCVKINGRIETLPYAIIDPQKDSITVNGKKVGEIEKKAYYAIHKPRGYVSASKSDGSHPPVTSLVPTTLKIYPVGRLDIDSEGLLILTNDGDLTYRLTHPKFHAPKQYHVEVSGDVSAPKIEKLTSGIFIDGKTTQPCQVKPLTQYSTGKWLEFTLQEGRHRQIRKMCAAVDLHVKRLIRVKIGKLALGNLKTGKYQSLNGKQIKLLEA